MTTIEDALTQLGESQRHSAEPRLDLLIDIVRDHRPDASCRPDCVGPAALRVVRAGSQLVTELTLLAAVRRLAAAETDEERQRREQQEAQDRADSIRRQVEAGR